jgi:hypothetical protein
MVVICGTSREASLLTVVEADNRHVRWNGEPKIGSRKSGADC